MGDEDYSGGQLGEDDDSSGLEARVDDLESRVDDLESSGGGQRSPWSHDVDSRTEDLESRLDAIESKSRVGYGGVSAGYSLGATLAVVMSWSANHAVLLAILHGIFSWIYVLYYVSSKLADS